MIADNKFPNLITVLVNGRESDQIPLADRGFQYGDGLFETIPIEHGEPEFLARHLERLRRGCERLMIDYPGDRILSEEAIKISQAHDTAILKIIITRGSGGRGYRITTGAQATRVLAIFPRPETPDEFRIHGIRATLCKTRLGINPALAGIKHLNRLEQILARSEWSSSEIHEGLMLDHEGKVIEGTMTNLFLVRGDRLITPDLSHCGVAGIMRGLVLELAQAHATPIEIRPVQMDDLTQADELFVTNSVIGLWPIFEFEKMRYAIGPVSRSILNWLDERKR